MTTTGAIISPPVDVFSIRASCVIGATNRLRLGSTAAPSAQGHVLLALPADGRDGRGYHLRPSSSAQERLPPCDTTGGRGSFPASPTPCAAVDRFRRSRLPRHWNCSVTSTADQIANVERNAGGRQKPDASRVGRAVGAVRWYCLRYGVGSPHPAGYSRARSA